MKKRWLILAIVIFGTSLWINGYAVGKRDADHWWQQQLTLPQQLTIVPGDLGFQTHARCLVSIPAGSNIVDYRLAVQYDGTVWYASHGMVWAGMVSANDEWWKHFPRDPLPEGVH